MFRQGDTGVPPVVRDERRDGLRRRGDRDRLRNERRRTLPDRMPFRYARLRLLRAGVGGRIAHSRFADGGGPRGASANQYLGFGRLWMGEKADA